MEDLLQKLTQEKNDHDISVGNEQQKRRAEEAQHERTQKKLARAEEELQKVQKSFDDASVELRKLKASDKADMFSPISMSLV